MQSQALHAQERPDALVHDEGDDGLGPKARKVGDPALEEPLRTVVTENVGRACQRPAVLCTAWVGYTVMCGMRITKQSDR